MAPSRCSYPDCVFHRLQTKLDFQHSLQDCNINHSINRDKDNKTNNIYMVVPYSKGLSESFKRVCNTVRAQVNFKGGNTIKHLLMAPKDKDNITNKGGLICRYKYEHPGCTMEYIGETGLEHWRQIQGAFKSPFLHLWPCQHHKSLHQTGQFLHHGQGVHGCLQDHKVGHVHQSQWPFPKQEHLQAPTATHLEWGVTGHAGSLSTLITPPYLPFPCHTRASPHQGRTCTSYW